MIYGKITPVAKVVNQITPFEVETVEGNYMGALARPYGLGSKSVNFEVLFGNIIQSEENGENKFERISSHNIKFESDELSNWGVDDTVMLTKIAEKLNATISEIVTINQNRPF